MLKRIYMSLVTSPEAVTSVRSITSIENAPIYPIDSLFDIPEDQPLGTIYFLDLDDLLIEHPHMLGSRAWRSYFATRTGGSGFANSAHDRVTLYLAENFPCCYGGGKDGRVGQESAR